MIHLTRLNYLPFTLNADLIEHIETAPDTVIALTTGQRFLVRETADEVVARVVAFRRSILEQICAECSIASHQGTMRRTRANEGGKDDGE